MEAKIDFHRHYQLNVTVLEARHLSVPNVNTVVEIEVGGLKQRMLAKTNKTEHPYYNKLFRFKFHDVLTNFLKERLRISIYQVNCFRLIGECFIEMVTIWEQTGHQYYHKWAILTQPKDPVAGIKGYLKCDIEIHVEGQHHTKIRGGYDVGSEIEGNLMVPFEGHYRRHHALFTTKIYSAGNIYATNKTLGKVRRVKCKNMFVKVTFAGSTACTQVLKKTINPMWNESLHFVENMPSLFQTINFELWDDKKNLLVGSNFLPLYKLWNQTNIGILPTFGPSNLFLYKQSKKNPYIRVLSANLKIGLDCRLLSVGETADVMKTKVISGLDPKEAQEFQEFTLIFVFFQCAFFKRKYYHNGSIRIRHGNQHEVGSDEDNNVLIKLNGIKKTGRKYYTWHSDNSLPVAHCKTFWPATDFREKVSNRIKYAVFDVSAKVNESKRLHQLGNTEEALKKCKEALVRLQKHCDQLYKYQPTPLDNNLDASTRIEFKEYLTKVKKNCAVLLKKKGLTPDDLLMTFDEHFLKLLVFADHTQQTFPDIEVAVVLPSNKIQTQVNLKPADYLFADKFEESGHQCGKVSTIILRNALGFEVAALDAMVWFSRSSMKSQCLKFLPGRNNNVEAALQEGSLKVERELFFELRVHVYQGRINRGADASGLADPFVRVLAFGETRETVVKAQTLDPLWDQTVIFSSMTFYCDRQFLKRESVGILFEVLDYDWGNQVELIGRGVVRPKVTLLNDAYAPQKLIKESAHLCGEKTADILMSMELIEIPEKCKNDAVKGISQMQILMIPNDIRPHFQQYSLELVFWGLRKFKTSGCPPKVVCVIECNGIRIESSLVSGQETINFEYDIAQAEIALPIQVEYSPPLVINLHQLNVWKKASFKGGDMVTYINRFVTKEDRNESKSKLLRFIPLKPLSRLMPAPKVPIAFHAGNKKSEPDWWTKYYASKHGQDTRLKIYEDELEKRPEFQDFQDFLVKFQLKKGKHDVRESMARPKPVGVLKCALALRQSSADNTIGLMHNSPRNDILDITVRVYIIAAFDLTATDVNGRCDPYIVLHLGKTKVSDRKSFIYKETNPVFGQCFELKGRFPWDHTLKVMVMDHDIMHPDDLIGQTQIDIENRFYSKHRGSCGIASTYEKAGYCKWRDLQEPSEILEETCKRCHLPSPQYSKDLISIGKYSFSCAKESRQEACLKILRNFEDIPEHGVPLVPEHVESRPLYHPKKPDIEQGKLEMWVDIFPGHTSLPSALDITPKEPEVLELRVIIWNMADVLLTDYSLLTGNRSSDVYVKGWLVDSDKSQRTDIHYRSFGEATFNWRFIFPFTYSPDENKMIVNKKRAFSNKVWKDKVPCSLSLQVWDNDVFSDDYLGSLNLDLWAMPEGAKFANKCSLQMLEQAHRITSLFRIKRTRGWWPVKSQAKKKSFGKGKTYVLTGKIDMELEIVSASEAKSKPAGLGREGPNPLPEPNRPITSIFWNLNPVTIMRRAICGGLGRILPCLVSVLLVGLTVYSIIWNVPAVILNKIFIKGT